MIKKYASVMLLVSLVALGTSGLLMIFLNDFAFQLKMHPVHKIFGIIMCASGSFHIYFNFKSIKNYLKNRKVAITAITLTILLVFLYGVGLNKPVDPRLVEEIERIMSH